MEDFLKNLFAVENIGTSSYFLVFAIAFLESIALIGGLIPGGTVVILAGFLAGQGYLSFFKLLLVAVPGAVLGDIFSFRLGDKNKNSKLFKGESRFIKKGAIEKGIAFFDRHGNKSIVIGRLIGFMRPVVPFVAGAMLMKKRSFILWCITSSFIWAILHLSFGYLFGAVFFGD